MKLWQAQQILCRYNPEAELHIRLPDGQAVKVDHLEDHYPREGGKKPTVGDRCPAFVMAVDLEDSWKTLRGEVPARDLAEYEYETTSRKCSQEGVDKAKIPLPPEGEGWELVTASLGGNSFWYFWRRPVV